MFEAARDVWYPVKYRSLAAKATNCQQCMIADRNLKTLLPKRDIGKHPEPSEPNECMKKYILVAADSFKVAIGHGYYNQHVG